MKFTDEELSRRGLVRGADGRIRPDWAYRSDAALAYFDIEWGVPVTDERLLFEHLCLEVLQVGLSFDLLLRRRNQLRQAFAGFNPDVLSTWTDKDIDAAMKAPGMIKNRRKIKAIVTNAKATVASRVEGGLLTLFSDYTPAKKLTRPTCKDSAVRSTPESTALAKEMKKRGFVFVGPTNMFALQQACGFIDYRPVGCDEPVVAWH